jgi:hypothetical protein
MKVRDLDVPGHESPAGLTSFIVLRKVHLSFGKLYKLPGAISDCFFVPVVFLGCLAGLPLTLFKAYHYPSFGSGKSIV